MTHDKEVTAPFKELRDISMTPGEQDELWQSISQEMKTMKPRGTRRKRSNSLATSLASVAAIAVVAVGIGVGIDKHVFSQTPTTKTTGASNMTNTSSNATGNSPTTSNSINNQAQDSSKWQDVGKMYEVQGVVSSVKGHSLELIVSKNIQGANSAVTSSDYPFKVDSVVSIRFDTSLSPKVGDHVVLNVSQYATGGNPFWGVLAANYYSERNGSYYNASGQKLSLPTSGATPAGTSNSSTTGHSSSQWQDVGKMYEVQGVITSASGYSLGLNVSKNIKGANSAVTNPNYPFKVGSVVNIQFDPSLSPKVGDHVVLDVSQYATGGSPFWGVIVNNYYTEQNGSYYSQSGQKLTLPSS